MPMRKGKLWPTAIPAAHSVLVGRPNLAAIGSCWAYGYRVERLSDWAGLLRDNPATEDFGDYAGQKRSRPLRHHQGATRLAILGR